jgi:hypothetical protein
LTQRRHGSPPEFFPLLSKAILEADPFGCICMCVELRTSSGRGHHEDMEAAPFRSQGQHSVLLSTEQRIRPGRRCRPASELLRARTGL